jgi:hypothetical protein
MPYDVPQGIATAPQKAGALGGRTKELRVDGF